MLFFKVYRYCLSIYHIQEITFSFTPNAYKYQSLDIHPRSRKTFVSLCGEKSQRFLKHSLAGVEQSLIMQVPIGPYFRWVYSLYQRRNDCGPYLVTTLQVSQAQPYRCKLSRNANFVRYWLEIKSKDKFCEILIC